MGLIWMLDSKAASKRQTNKQKQRKLIGLVIFQPCLTLVPLPCSPAAQFVSTKALLDLTF